MDWGLFGLLILGCLAMTLLSICLQRREYEYKKQIGYRFVPGDFKCTSRNAIKLSVAGLLIGFITAMTGIGAGVISNALLLKIDMHPRVASETAQFLGVPICFGASIFLLIYNQLRLDYGIVQAILVIAGTFIGIHF